MKTTHFLLLTSMLLLSACASPQNKGSVKGVGQETDDLKTSACACHEDAPPFYKDGLMLESK
jgi:hypothetical protein